VEGVRAMKLVDLSLRDFVSKVDSAQPAPGGGSVSAVASSLGSALLRMVGHLTIPKKKFQKLDTPIQEALIKTHEAIKGLEVKLLDLVDRDTDAFNAIMSAYRMPKDSEQAIKKRNKAVEQATIKAIEVPESIASIALEALNKVDLLIHYGNQFALSDIGVGILLLYAGMEGALLNMKINLANLNDEALKSSYMGSIKKMLKEGILLRNQLLDKIHDKIDKTIL
jgi:formiminotetrahydrofolate cyclodeaminase